MVAADLSAGRPRLGRLPLPPDDHNVPLSGREVLCGRAVEVTGSHGTFGAHLGRSVACQFPPASVGVSVLTGLAGFRA